MRGSRKHSHYVNTQSGSMSQQPAIFSANLFWQRVCSWFMWELHSTKQCIVVKICIKCPVEFFTGEQYMVYRRFCVFCMHVRWLHACKHGMQSLQNYESLGSRGFAHFKRGQTHLMVKIKMDDTPLPSTVSFLSSPIKFLPRCQKRLKSELLWKKEEFMFSFWPKSHPK